MKKLIIPLIFFLLFVSQMPNLTFAISNQGSLLQTKIYFKSTNSDVLGYKQLSAIKPTGTTNQTIIINVTTNGLEPILFGKWLSPSVFIMQNITIERYYNFLFSIWGNKTTATNNNASFSFELGVYKNGSEIPFFTTGLSAELPKTQFDNLLWQYKTFQNYTFVTINRIYLKAFLNPHGSGIYYFAYDSSIYCSYFLDPTETRYMANYFYDGISNANGFNLTTTNSVTGTSTTINNSTVAYGACYVGIRVWHNLTEITSGVPVAQVQVYDGESQVEKYNTWNCPLTSLFSTEDINVTVFVQFGTFWIKLLIATFRTEILHGQSLDASTWNVTYYLSLTADYVKHRTSVSMQWGSSSRKSRIENFKWTVAPSGTFLNLYGISYLNEIVSSNKLVLVNKNGLQTETLTNSLNRNIQIRKNGLVNIDLTNLFTKTDVSLALGLKNMINFLVSGNNPFAVEVTAVIAVSGSFVLLILLFVACILLMIKRIPIISFVIGMFTIVIAIWSLEDTTIPLNPITCVLFALVGVSCIMINVLDMK
jgi:hypothetical protein